MVEINLKERYSGYYIRLWKKQGLPLIKQRPPTTTEELLEDFFRTISSGKKRQPKAIQKSIRKSNLEKLDWRDYLREEYKWKRSIN